MAHMLSVKKTDIFTAR